MKRWALIITGVLILATLAYCKNFFIPYTWHQKMTLEVEVEGQLYTGSSVVEVNVGNSDPITEGLGFPLQFGARGEAAFVELPENKYLFALLSGGPPDSGPKTNAVNIFKDQLPRTGIERFEVLSASQFKRDIPRSHYPLLVTFTDINDPKTVKKVEPDNLSVTFGPGVSLKRITLEITDEAVTEGKIENGFGWWCSLRKKRARLNGKTGPISDNELSNNLGTGSFKIGKCQ